MALQNVVSLKNAHKSSTLLVQYINKGTANVKDKPDQKIGGSGNWFEIPPTNDSNDPTVVDVENMVVPWADRPHNGLYVKWTVDGITYAAVFDQVAQGVWDYQRVRDMQDHVLLTNEVGSCGVAAGTNFSWWNLILLSDGTVVMSLINRQGLIPNGIEVAGDVLLKVTGKVISSIAEGVTEGIISALKE